MRLGAILKFLVLLMIVMASVLSTNRAWVSFCELTDTHMTVSGFLHTAKYESSYSLKTSNL